jgi:branched-chain amino acid transport system ATP-binding protein
MLRVQNISVKYEQIQALRRITFEVKSGEIVCILGANGAGKTTVLRTISGLLRVHEGTIEFFGENITRLSSHEIVRLGIAHVPEGRHIFPDLSVQENLLMGAYLRNDARGIQEDLEYVSGLFPILKKRYFQMGGTLSGGEQQMLAIARGLMGRPKLLILDEPSLGLAPILVDMIFKTLQALGQKGVTILLVEQNTHQSLAIASRGYVLETGKLILSGTASELLNNPLVQEAYLGG